MIEVAERIINILDQAQGAVVNIEVEPESFIVQSKSTPGAEPPFITGFGGAQELAAILGAFSCWRGAFEVSGIQTDGHYEFWIN